MKSSTEGKMLRHSGANAKKQFSDEMLKDILTSTASLRSLGRKYNVCHGTITAIKKEYELCPAQ